MAVRGDRRPSYYVKYSKYIPIFSYFYWQIPIFFLIFRGTNSYFPIFLTIPITWHPELDTLSKIESVLSNAKIKFETIFLAYLLSGHIKYL